MDQQAKQRELAELRSQVRQLEQELAQDRQQQNWPPQRYYTAYHALAGFMLGMFGAATSLLFNVIGSLLVGQAPLHLIQIYLTFPMGEGALQTNTGIALAIGCCLYIATGMILGIPFQLVLSRWFSKSSFGVRFVVVTLMALGLWAINFYGILSWLQPVLFGGRWILDMIPWGVAAATHLVFGWTMLLVQPLGTFVPYQQEPERV